MKIKRFSYYTWLNHQGFQSPPGPPGQASGHQGTCKNYPERPWRRPCVARERPGTSKNACRFTWTRPEHKQKIPKHRKRKPSVQKASKCYQNSTNSHAFEPEHELSKSIIGATQGPQGGCRAPPWTTQAPGSTLPSVPGNVPGAPRKPRNSSRTLSRLPRRIQVSKKGSQSLPKASQEVPGGPRRHTET